MNLCCLWGWQGRFGSEEIQWSMVAISFIWALLLGMRLHPPRSTKKLKKKKTKLPEIVPPIENINGIQPKLFSKVNWDAAIEKFNGHLGICIVVRGHEEYVHRARSMTRLEHLELIAAEALHVSFFYKESGLHNIILEGDALQVIKAVSSNVYN
jgi:hypothetical protein